MSDFTNSRVFCRWLPVTRPTDTHDHAKAQRRYVEQHPPAVRVGTATAGTNERRPADRTAGASLSRGGCHGRQAQRDAVSRRASSRQRQLHRHPRPKRTAGLFLVFFFSSLLLLLLMVSSSLYVSHMFVTRVLSSLVFRVLLL